MALVIRPRIIGSLKSLIKNNIKKRDKTNIAEGIRLPEKRTPHKKTIVTKKIKINLFVFCFIYIKGKHTNPIRQKRCI